jgi:hypothetical protein
MVYHNDTKEALSLHDVSILPIVDFLTSPSYTSYPG